MATILDGAFGALDLTESIIDVALPDKPQIDNLLDWDEQGIETTSALIERAGEVIDFIPTVPRGGPGQGSHRPQRGGVTVNAVHIKHSDSVLADQVQDVRAMGRTSLDSPAELQKRTLMAMKKNLVWTQAMHRLGAIKGLVLDADGSTLLDMFALWGLSQQTVSFDLDEAGTNLALKGVDVERKSQDALVGGAPTEYVGLASPTFMDALRAHAYYEKVLQFAAPSQLLQNYRTGITVGNIAFVEVRAPAGSPVAIEDNTAYVVPKGQGILLARYAPADWNETVNTLGLPFYAKAQALPMDRGYSLEAQTNPFHVVTHPRAIIKVTAS